MVVITEVNSAVAFGRKNIMDWDLFLSNVGGQSYVFTVIHVPRSPRPNLAFDKKCRNIVTPS